MRQELAMEIDWGTLYWALSQSDLTITAYEDGQSADGQQSLDSAPNEALFVWKRGDENVWSIEVDRRELEECISRLERERVPVPSDFRAVARHFVGQ